MNIPNSACVTCCCTMRPTTCRSMGRVPGDMLKCATLTQAWNVKFAPHAMENIHLHLVAALPNAPFLERLLMFEDITAQMFKGAPKPIAGFMEVPELPGLGLQLDSDFIRDHDERARNH